MAYCDGTTAVPGVYLMCDTEKSTCVSNELAPSGPINCAALGQVCSAGECVENDLDTCTPGETFPDDDGCNTCTCPESGFVSDAACTEIACKDCYTDEDCGDGAECAEGACILSKECAADSDCEDSKTAASCDGNILTPATIPTCDQQTGMCILEYAKPFVDCAATGLTCIDAACVATEGCASNFDCGSGATPPYCDGDMAVESTYPTCDPETKQCVTAGGKTTDCAALGLICDFGECIAQ